MGRHLQIAMDRVAVAPRVFGAKRVRFFRRSSDSPGWAEHVALRAPVVPELDVDVPSEVIVALMPSSPATARMPAGPRWWPA